MKIDLLGVKINADTKIQLLADLQNLLEEDPSTPLGAGQPVFIVTPYSESIVAAQKDQEFKTILNSADFALPDGIGLLWAARYLKRLATSNKRLGLEKFWLLIKTLAATVINPRSLRDPIPEKISGSEFIWDLAEFAAKNNYSIFLLGGFGDTPALAAAALKKEYPDLRIAGSSNFSHNVILESRRYVGTIGSQDSIAPLQNDIVNQINSANPDFLFVALGPIKQEKWIYENLPNLRIKLAIGLGGTFDYLAGIRPYRPKFWALRGLEWLWRLITQPWRVKRIFRGVFGLIYYSFMARVK